MALKIYWTKRADSKFNKIIEYLHDEWGEKVARTFVKKVYELLDLLVEYPQIGPVENREKASEVSLLSNKSIFFTESREIKSYY